MSGPCFLAPANMCDQENLPAWFQLQHHIHAEREFNTRTHTHTAPPHPPPETHRDRSLIHIFLLGADFSSRGDGQSDSSISGGLRGDSSMLSHCLENRRRRQPLCSASDPYREILAPHPRPFPTCGWRGPARPVCFCSAQASRAAVPAAASLTLPG